MKKVIFILLNSIIFLATAADCSEAAQKVISKLAQHNRSSVTINYSVDKADWANTCKNAILAKNSKLTINMNKVNASDVFKFSK